MKQKSKDQEYPVTTKTETAISMGRVNVIVFVLSPVLLAIFLIPYWLLWGPSSIREAVYISFSPPYSLLFMSSLVFGIVVHEALHGLGWSLFGRVPRNAIQFGVKWKILTPFAHSTVPMRASGYRVGILLPGIALGVVPGMIGILLGIGWLTLWGIIMFVAAGGDFITLWVMHSVPPNSCVLDHPDKTGCVVLSNEA